MREDMMIILDTILVIIGGFMLLCFVAEGPTDIGAKLFFLSVAYWMGYYTFKVMVYDKYVD